MRLVRLGLAQINTTVGDLAGNEAAIRDRLEEARAEGCGVVVFPELAVTGYPPEDLLLRRSFCEASRETVLRLAGATAGLVAVVGFVDWDGDAYNAAALLVDGQWVDTYRKQRLPNYGVFDEERYFTPGFRTPVYEVGRLRFGISICEDIWYPGRPVEEMALAGAELCLNINASPYYRGKRAGRARLIGSRAVDNVIAIAYVNQVGGQDELVFDGGSLVFDGRGTLLASGPQFEEALVVVDVDLDAVGQQRLHDPRRRVELKAAGGELDVEYVEVAASFDPVVEAGSAPPLRPLAPLLEDEQEVWQALVVGTRDYLAKTGFRDVLVGLSGGIDSSVVAAIAVDALGAGHVTGVSMPSRYSSDHSRDDARDLAERLGIRYLSVPIEPAHAAMLAMLADAFEGTAEGTAEENLQSRQRGNVLMTLSNKFGALVLTTGNKSEMATGYATLYGDMAGGYGVLKDVPKTLVYRISEWRNGQPDGPLIPQGVLTKPPSAELRPGQVDQDSLPPYDVLDPILEAYVEDDLTRDEIVSMGFDDATVRRVIALVDRNEYKRRQAPPGVKITERAFGRDRRFPLASRWRGDA